MHRGILVRLVGVFMLLYGVAAIPVAWWAYSVTHLAFTSVREFVTTFQHERDAAVGALNDALGLLGNQDSTSSATANSGSGSGAGGSPAATPTPSTRSGASQVTQDLGRTLRSILGAGQQSGSSGQQSSSGGQQSGSSGQQSSSSSSSGGGSGLLGVVDQIENRLVDTKNRWLRLGDGPLPGNQLDQLELVTNVVLGWLALTGVIAFIGGLSLLLRRDAPARSAPPPAWPQQYPPQPYAGYAPGPGGYPPPGPPAPPSDRGSRPDW